MRNKTIGPLIRAARERKGLTQAELGRAIGIRNNNTAQVTISKYERDVVFPTNRLGGLVKVLKLPRKRVTALAMSQLWSV